MVNVSDENPTFLSYQEAHRRYINIEHVLPATNGPVFESYAWAVQECPDLARFKLYDDCSAFLEREIRYATGNRLKALIVWTAMMTDFWDRCEGSYTCPVYVSTWKMMWAQGLQYRLMRRDMVTKPWRRSDKKDKLKSPKLNPGKHLPTEIFH